MGPDQTIEAMHAALGPFVSGDPAPFQALLSRSADVTLANPFGPPVRGIDAVLATTNAAATHYHDGTLVGTERISQRHSEQLAVIVEIEHLRARLEGTATATDFSLRATTVLAHEDGAWRILVRHADPITTPRTIDEALGPPPSS